MKTVSRNVTMGGADDSLLLPKTNGILGRLGVLASFDFDEDQDVAVPGDHVDFTALGDPVNVSARMQQHAAGGELLIASGVADDLVAKSPRLSLNLRGHEQPIDAFVLGA